MDAVKIDVGLGSVIYIHIGRYILLRPKPLNLFLGVILIKYILSVWS